ncbi:MAG: TolB-like 6-bladed beta-propeller domain-containing protein [Rikenellaceae bacterium]|nr:TolB-like 6-bladed beta-propeller domain-containing protein [Rikenellaceae bacterium]
MNKLTKTIVSALFIVPVLISCKGEGRYLSIGEPCFVSGFPAEGIPKQIDRFHCDEIGLQSIKVVDTLLFVDRGSAWVIYSLDGKRKYGECMSVGRGPGEFTYSIPWVRSCYFFHDRDSLFVYTPEKHIRCLYELNITELIAGGNKIPHIVIKTDNINSDCWAVTPCGKDRMLLTKADDYYTSVQRLMYENDTVTQLSVTRGIDEVTINPNSDLNLITKAIRYNTAADKFVEAMCHLNQINLYSADGTEGKTICVGKKLDDVSKIEKEPKFSRKDTYTTVEAWDEGFGALYLGRSKIDVQKLLSEKSQIQFFDWEGNPKYLVELPYQVSAFDIDFNNNVLYAIDPKDDKLIAYDATEIVKALRN